jgi:NAD(P)-dependent dehydrogenase (short-subunit alcohol dehydrogenase family)
MDRVGGQLVLVTGAAGGIGTATCRAFLDAGYAVAGLDISARVSEHPAEGEYVGLVADVLDPDSVQAALAALALPVAHLVTCAGIALTRETTNDGGHGLPDVATFRESVELNLTSHYITLDAVWPQLRDGVGNRSVSFASSINALQSFGMPAYSAAKAGLIGLVHALVVPLGRFGVRVNAVAPGTVPTATTVAEWEHVPTHFDHMAAVVPLGKLGEPDDVAATFLALARDLTHVSGQTVIVDGGQSLHR